jgi:uncharacterized protein YigE (DUF2233 family)
MKKWWIMVALAGLCIAAPAQLRWQEVTARFGPLPKGLRVFYSNDSLDGRPFVGYYVEADLANRGLRFSAATGNGQRLTPGEYYNREGKPWIVVNCTFFNFDKNQNLNLVVNKGRMKAYNIPFVKGRGKDSTSRVKPFRSAIGITQKRRADVAWIYADTGMRRPMAAQRPVTPINADSLAAIQAAGFKKWKVRTAVGGGPVLVQNGAVLVTNNEELLFAGKALYDQHPRTAMGYTNDGRLIILAIQGRFPGLAEGANLLQEAQLLAQLGCHEALNLDGGGSTCLLVNGQETVKPSDKTGQRPVPAVFVVHNE